MRFHKTAAMGLSVLLSTALIVPAATAFADSSTEVASIVSGEVFPPMNFSTDDLESIAIVAEENGDGEGAASLRETASCLKAKQEGIEPQNWATSIAKKAVTTALRWGAEKLPKAIRPYAGKTAGFLEALDNWTDGPIIAGMLELGIPYDIVQAALTWIHIFLI